jgi:hypothetical protein
MENSPFVTNSLANGAREHIIGPGPRACFLVRGNVRRNEPELSIIAPDMTAALSALHRRRAWSFPVATSMTDETLKQSFGEILSALAARLRALEHNSGQWAYSRVVIRRGRLGFFSLMASAAATCTEYYQQKDCCGGHAY